MVSPDSLFSLQSTWIRNSILRAIRLSKNKADVHKIPSNFVYANPTIQKLGDYFWRLLSGSHDVSEQNHTAHIQTRCLEMESLITKYTADIPTPRWKVTSDKRHVETIVLTGSTGRLGCYLLKQMVEREDIIKVFALNRPSASGVSAETRQNEALKTWNVSLDSSTLKKVVFLDYDPSKYRLGLTEDTYSTVSFFPWNVFHC
jgi:hypothetical protein